MIRIGVFRLAVLLICGLLLCIPGRSFAAQLRIAAASNFKTTLLALQPLFEQASGHTLSFSFASSGKHYAQIKYGAPFDAFFSADHLRPLKLERQGLTVAKQRFTYAIGKLVLWSPVQDLIDADGQVLREGRFRHLAIANPKLAPYGRAAQQVLLELGLWQSLQQHMVRGENINQTFQFINSGNAELGFVALSQVLAMPSAQAGRYWLVPKTLYAPIEQQAVLLKDSAAARAFFQFMRSDKALQMIRDYGYDTPDHE